MSTPKFSPFIMETPIPPRRTIARLAGILLMFFGVQALFIAGSYYFPHWRGFSTGLSRGQQLHITIWVVVAANMLVLGLGLLRSGRKPLVTPPNA